MAAPVSKKTWIRVTGSRTGTGEISLLAAPIRGWIRRARVVGTGNLTLSVDEASVPGMFGAVLAYASTATPIDQEEDPGIFYSIPAVTTDGNSDTGTLFAEVTTSGGATAITVQLDIEPAN